MRYSAVIFDLDGLMVDTERMCFELWKEMGKSIGVDVPIEIYRQVIGGDIHSVEKVFAQYPYAYDVVNLTRPRRNDYIYEFFPNPGDGNKPGLKELVDYLKKHDYKIAVASSSKEVYVNRVLNHLGFDLAADVVVTGSDVERAKPHPAIFHLAAQKLVCKPSECLVLEDSKNGIIAAKAADMDVIFIEDLVPADETMITSYLAKMDTMFDVITFLNNL